MVRDAVPARGHPDHHQDHTQEGEMTTLLPQRENKSIRNNHQDMIIETTAMMLIIATMSKFCS